MKKVRKGFDELSIMIRPTTDSNVLKINLLKSLKLDLQKGDFIFSHKDKMDEEYYFEILEVVEKRQSTMKDYSYETFKVKQIKSQKSN